MTVSPPVAGSSAPAPGALLPEPPVTVTHRAVIAARAYAFKAERRDGLVQGGVLLWPSAEPAQVLFEVKGRLGSPIFVVPERRGITVSSSGKVFLSGAPAFLYDLQGGAPQPLGASQDARFFDHDSKLYVWSEPESGARREGVFDIAANKLLVEQPLDTGSASTSVSIYENPLRVIREGEATLVISELPSLRPLVKRDAIYSCFAPGAQAVLSFTNETLPGAADPGAIVYQRLAPLAPPIKKPGGYLLTLPSACTFDVKGERAAWAMGGIELFDAKARRVRTVFAADLPEHERYAIYNLEFTEDGGHICASQSGESTAYRLDGKGPLTDTKLQSVYCFYHRGAGKIARIPGTKGYERWPSLAGLYYRRFTQALSPDGLTAAVVQAEILPPGKESEAGTKRKIALILADVAASKVLHRIEVGSIVEEEDAGHYFDIQFTRDGKTIALRGGAISAAYDVATGAKADMPGLPPLDTSEEYSERRGPLEIFSDRVLEIATGERVQLGGPDFTDAAIQGKKVLFASEKERLEIELPRTWPLEPDSRIPVPQQAKLEGGSIRFPARDGEPERIIPVPPGLESRGRPWISFRHVRSDRILMLGPSVLALLDGEGAVLTMIVPSSTEGAVAFFPSGRYERLGRTSPSDSLFCRDGVKVLPMSACDKDLEVKGRLERFF